MGGIVARECGVRNAECGISGGASIRGSTFHLHSAFRTPHSALLMSVQAIAWRDRKSTRLNSSHGYISYAVFCLKKKKRRAPTASISKESRAITGGDETT